MRRSGIFLACLSILVFVGCSDSNPKRSEAAERTCAAPENPYEEGSGHYAGYKWAEETGGECNGNSNSFNEGCEEYYAQQDDYEQCEARQQ